MVGTNNTSEWKVPKFSLSTANQAKESKAFYVRALDYLETQGIDIDAPTKQKQMEQIKMMFMGKERQTL